MAWNDDFWKDQYQSKWKQSSQKEKAFKDFITKKTGLILEDYGLGAGTSSYLTGNARSHDKEKGDPDFKIVNTNIFIEVTGPLKYGVGFEEDLWIRPDKIENAINHPDHDTFIAHRCENNNGIMWRIIHINDDFKARYIRGEFEDVYPYINHQREHYKAINASDGCIEDLNVLISYLKKDS